MPPAVDSTGQVRHVPEDVIKPECFAASNSPTVDDKQALSGSFDNLDIPYIDEEEREEEDATAS